MSKSTASWQARQIVDTPIGVALLQDIGFDVAVGSSPWSLIANSDGISPVISASRLTLGGGASNAIGQGVSQDAGPLASGQYVVPYSVAVSGSGIPHDLRLRVYEGLVVVHEETITATSTPLVSQSAAFAINPSATATVEMVATTPPGPNSADGVVSELSLERVS